MPRHLTNDAPELYQGHRKVGMDEMMHAGDYLCYVMTDIRDNCPITDFELVFGYRDRTPRETGAENFVCYRKEMADPNYRPPMELNKFHSRIVPLP